VIEGAAAIALFLAVHRGNPGQIDAGDVERPTCQGGGDTLVGEDENRSPCFPPCPERRAHHAKADQHEGQAEERKHDGHDLYRAIGPWSIAEKKVGSAMYSQRSAKAVQGTTKIQIGRADQNAFQRSGQPAHWIVSPSNSVRIFLRKPGGSSSSIVR
jgi:hypothetical protein